MRTLLTIILIYATLISYAQKKETNYLATWNNTALQDTIRLHAVHEFININYHRIPPDSIFYLAQLQYDFANKKGLQSYLAKALNSKGKAYSLFGDFDNAIDLHETALNICEEVNCKKGILESVTNLGNVFYEKDEYDQAIDYYHKSAVASKVLNNHKSEAAAYNGLAVIYKTMDNSKDAILFFTKALQINESISDQMEIAHSLCNLAIVNAIEGDFQKAIEQFKLTYDIQENLKLKRDMSESLMNIGNIYYILGDNATKAGDMESSERMYSMAIDYNEKALVLAREVGSVTEIKHAAKDLMLEYYVNDMPEEITQIHDPAIGIQKRINNLERKREALKSTALQDSYEKPLDNEDSNFKFKKDIKNKSFWMWTLFLGSSALLTFYIIRYKKRSPPDEKADHATDTSKSSITLESMMNKDASAANTEKPPLNRKNIEIAAKGSLNETDWKILNVLYQTPGINNRGIADSVSLSVDGVRSSLRKMYRIFEITKAQKNQRIALVVLAIKISNEEANQSGDN